jgi:hypothetical protein
MHWMMLRSFLLPTALSFTIFMDDSLAAEPMNRLSRGKAHKHKRTILEASAASIYLFFAPICFAIKI